MIDAHMHLLEESNLETEFNLHKFEDKVIENKIIDFIVKLKKNAIDKALLYICDTEFDIKKYKFPTNIIVGKVLDTRNKNFEEIADILENFDAKIIKLLPYDCYDKRLNNKEFLEDIINLIDDKILSICATYGSKHLYDINGVEIANKILRESDIPIIVCHAGGVKVLDVLQLAEAYDNLYMDLSFTPYYWYGSSVIKDLAFTINKLNCERIFYGSDCPFVSINDAMNYFKYLTSDMTLYEINLLTDINFIKFEEKYLK